MDGHIRILNLRINRQRQDVAALEAHLNDLEVANALLSAKVAALELCLCHCGQEEQPIMMEDGEREESSPSSYQTPPVASPDENEEPLPVRIMTMRRDSWCQLLNRKRLNELFRAINQEREVDHDDQEEFSVRSPNHQWRRVRVRHCAQVLHAMSTAVDIQPRVLLQRINGFKGAVQHN